MGMPEPEMRNPLQHIPGFVRERVSENTVACPCISADPRLLYIFAVFRDMIRFFLLQNKQGKTRLSKWYQNAPDDLERVKLEADVHRIISMRGRGFTNFVEVSIPFDPPPPFVCQTF